MNRLQLLEKSIAATKRLIGVSQDAKEIETLEKELEALIEERGTLKAEMAAEEKAAKDKADAEAKAAHEEREKAKAGVVIPQPVIKVTGGKTELYKGFNLNREVKLAGMRAQTHGRVIDERFKADPELAMGISKWFIDMYAKALDNPLRSLEAMQKAANQEDTDSEGGYLVPTEQRMEVLAYARESSVALRLGTMIPMTSLSMTIPRELTKVTVAITDEEGQATSTNPTFDQVTLTAKRFDGTGITSNELLQDAALNGGLVGLLLDQFIEANGKKVDSAVFVGTGSPMSGLFIGGAGYSVVLGTGSSTFASVGHSSIMETMSKITEEDAANAVWLIHRTPRLVNIRTIKDTAGNPLYVANAIAREPDTVMGYPVYSSSQMPGTSAVSTAIAVFGDMRGIYVGERLTNMSIFLDPYTRADYYQTRFFFFTRWALANALPKKFARLVTAAS